ncbi:MAG TPA: pyruvate kinase [Chromatiaceae bacterium]|jgi:pyruvate kinase|nr:MAG: pyruvate kinase [Thiohalocapsa sp. PB-PSB1]HBG95468.1 pyruvate kinase [Chromatiaceae bacterium]HCS91115.1 pyruvate kinase [Chromatiaceae bacterium]
MQQHTLTSRQLERIEVQLAKLREGALELESEYANQLAEIDPGHRASARNLLHYLSIRQHDIRHLQHDLASLGLSSLGVLEPHVMASLNAVIGVLGRLTGKSYGDTPELPVDHWTGPLLLKDHTRALLGPDPQGRFVRIMVTMPSEAACNPQLVQDLLAAGMDCMRINCAHDGPDAWAAMVENLRMAEKALGRGCRIQADLGGPKLRTGAIAPSGRVTKIKPQRDTYGRVVIGGRVWITDHRPDGNAPLSPPEDADFSLNVSGNLVGLAKSGDLIALTDAREQAHEMRVVEADGASLLAEIDRTAYVAEGATLKAERNGVVIAAGRAVGVPEVINPILLMPGDRLDLMREARPGTPAQRDAEGKVIQAARIHCTLEAAFEQVEPGHAVWFDDGKIGGLVRNNDGQRIHVEITQTPPQGAKLRAEKGINFPDTLLRMSALTDKDLVDLPAITPLVDMVALSFVREPGDVQRLHDELYRLDASHLGVILKIENRQAFENLPRILLASLHSPPVGVMIARGDLAVEVGFERLSEVQQEILWVCEAAHVPVIWATQILEGMAKRGAPSRAEVSDATMSILAECAMLNKGPNIVETVRFLSGIIGRMDEHYIKRRATLRKLSIANL